MNWSEEKIKKIAAADDMHISPFREDGKTYGTPTWIGSVVIDVSLYARAYNGQHSRRYAAAREQGAGRISIAGLTEEVTFEAIGDAASTTASMPPTVPNIPVASIWRR